MVEDDQARQPHITPLAPWDVWQPRSEYVIAIELEEQGELQAALRNFRNIGSETDYKKKREFGILLKQGETKRMLDELSIYLGQLGVPIKQAPSELAFLAAFAYVGQQDIQQSLAWFSLAAKNADYNSPVRSISLSTSKKLIAGTSRYEFSDIYSRWKADEQLGSLVKQERAKRAEGWSGNEAGIESFVKFFDSSYYRASDLSIPEVISEEVMTSKAEFILGSVLPLSGRYARFASSVKNGIELAVEEQKSLGFDVEVIFADSKAEARSASDAYKKLVNQNVIGFLGPMLTESSSSLAKAASELKVPFVSFSKSPGVPQESDYAFRLGVTAIDQAAALVRYAREQKGANYFLVFTSNTSVAQALTRSFVEQVDFAGGQVQIVQMGYGVLPPELMNAQADAIFFAESLKASLPVIIELQNSSLKGTPLLGSASWGSSEEIAQAGELINGAVIAHPFDPSSTDPKVRDFVFNYRQSYGTSPTLLEAQSYDAAKLMLQAVFETTYDKPLSDKLKEFENFGGVTGTLSVLPSGEISRDVRLGYVSGGKIFELR